MVEIAIFPLEERLSGDAAVANLRSSLADRNRAPGEIEHLYPTSPALRRLVVLSQELEERDLRRLVRDSPSLLAKVVGESRRVGLGALPLEQLLFLKGVPSELLREAIRSALTFRSSYEPGTNERMHQNQWMRAMLRAQCVRELAKDSVSHPIEPNTGALAAMCADIGYQVATVLYASSEHLPQAVHRRGPDSCTIAWDHGFAGPGGPGHSQLGAQLLAAWDVDAVIVDAVENHHCPQLARAESKPYSMAIFLANAVIWNIPAVYEEQDYQEEYASVPADYLRYFGISAAVLTGLVQRMQSFAIWLRSQSTGVLPLARRRTDSPAHDVNSSVQAPKGSQGIGEGQRVSYKARALKLLAVPSLTPYCSALSDLARLEVMNLQLVALAVESSPSMTAFLVGRANEIWHRQQGYEVLSVQEAISVVGENALRAMLADFAQANDQYAKATAGQMTGCATYWMHATAVAFAARELSKRIPAALGVSAKELELLAYVHQIGQSAMAYLDPPEFTAHLSVAVPDNLPAQQAPLKDFAGVAMPIDTLGAIVCRKWGVPEVVCEALEGFRNPEKMPVSRAQTLAYALLVAKALVIDAALPYPEPLALRPVRRFNDKELAALGLERRDLVAVREAVAQCGQLLPAQYAGLRDYQSA
jgi:HD-like signal output (HDOD) protein